MKIAHNTDLLDNYRKILQLQDPGRPALITGDHLVSAAGRSAWRTFPTAGTGAIVREIERY